MQDLNVNLRAPVASATKEPQIPLDLRLWIEPTQLREWVTEEMEALDWQNEKLQKYLQTHPDFRPKELLSLLIFAYATGVMESEDIIAALQRNDGLNGLWRGPGPSAKEISMFRKKNRALLKWGLGEVIKRALQQKLGYAETRLPAGLRQVVVDSAVGRLDLARHMDGAA